MKVFVAVWDEYGDGEIIGVFSAKNVAERAAEISLEKHGYADSSHHVSVQEFALDHSAPQPGAD